AKVTWALKVTARSVTRERWAAPPLITVEPTRGAVATWASKAPMSVPAPLVRAKPAPRWSVVRPAGLLPVLSAALPAPRAMVCVGPPLLASGCRFRAAPNGRLLALAGLITFGPGSLPMALNVAVTMLVPLTATSLYDAPAAAVLPERMVLCRVMAPTRPAPP